MSQAILWCILITLICVFIVPRPFMFAPSLIGSFIAATFVMIEYESEIIRFIYILFIIIISFGSPFVRMIMGARRH